MEMGQNVLYLLQIASWGGLPAFQQDLGGIPKTTCDFIVLRQTEPTPPPRSRAQAFTRRAEAVHVVVHTLLSWFAICLLFLTPLL